jgi:hypothetical protein
VIDFFAGVWTVASLGAAIVGGLAFGWVFVGFAIRNPLFSSGLATPLQNATLTTLIGAIGGGIFWLSQILAAFYDGDPLWWRIASRFTVWLVFCAGDRHRRLRRRPRRAKAPRSSGPATRPRPVQRRQAVTRSARRRVRWLAIIAGAIALTLSGADVRAGTQNCRPAWKCSSPGPTATASPTVAPTPVSGVYSFDDEFSGTALSSAWGTNYHVPSSALVAYDAPTVSGGYLHLPLRHLADGWHGSLIDTKLSFTQRYGTFEARMAFPKGKGIWPAFWGYTGGPEIDGMEICANPLGANGGNDASLLHQTIHFSGSSSTAFPTRHADLSAAFHTYRWTWTSSSIAFFLDGAQTAKYSGTPPAVAMPVIVDLAVGGPWCSNPDSTTPNGEVLVDWIRVTP